MSRYSYKVEKLLRETKSPSLGILLEEEGDEKEEETTAEEPESGSEGNDEGIPDDAFSDEETAEGGDEGGDAEEELPDGSGESDSKKLADIEAFIEKSELAGANIRDRAHEKRFRGLANDFFKDLDRISAKSDSFSKTFESKTYSNKSIKGFLFEAEGDEDSQENIESSIESLENTLNSEENQLPDPFDLAKTSYKYFERFDDVDKAIYIIKLVSKYFKRFIDPNKDKVFDEFLDRFLDILQENGISIELDGSKAVQYRTAVGARTAG